LGGIFGAGRFDFEREGEERETKGITPAHQHERAGHPLKGLPLGDLSLGQAEPLLELLLAHAHLLAANAKAGNQLGVEVAFNGGRCPAIRGHVETI